MVPVSALVIVTFGIVLGSITLSSTFASAEENECDVIVIGAGMSGLAAAKHLQENECDVLVLEARDRVGGRMWTDRSWNDISLDLGASWIHGLGGHPSQEPFGEPLVNPITDLARDYGLPLFIFDDEESVVVYEHNGTKIDDADYIDSLYEEFKAFYLNEHKALLKNNEDISLQKKVDEFVGKLTDEEYRQLNYTLVWNIEGEYGADASDLSLRAFPKMGYKMSGREAIFPRGYDQVVKRLADEVGADKILLKHVVEKVDYSDEKIVTVTTNKEPFTAKYVISTLPLGVLQKDSVDFIPDLPPWKTKAINSLKMGVLSKAYFVFDEAFWDDVTWITYIPEQKGHWVYFANLQSLTGAPVLLAFNSGEYGLEIDKKWKEGKSDEIVSEAMKILTTIYGKDGKIYGKDGNVIKGPVYVNVTKWGADEYSWGSYSYTAVNSSNADYYTMSKPVDDRIFFAGEATEVNYPATVHGAFFSGMREANRILIQSSGEIPSPKEQMDNWVLPNYVICGTYEEGNETKELKLIVSSDGSSAACVKPATKSALMDRGWGKENLY